MENKLVSAFTLVWSIRCVRGGSTRPTRVSPFRWIPQWRRAIGWWQRRPRPPGPSSLAPPTPTGLVRDCTCPQQKHSFRKVGSRAKERNSQFSGMQEPVSFAMQKRMSEKIEIYVQYWSFQSIWALMKSVSLNQSLTRDDLWLPRFFP